MGTFVADLAAFRLRHPADVQAETDALLERVIGQLDDLSTYASAIHGRMYADGLLPDRRATNREESA